MDTAQSGHGPHLAIEGVKAARHHRPPPRFYTWDAPGTCGVTDDRREAAEHVRQALESTPGALGKIRKVTVNPSGRIEYLTLGKVAIAHVDAHSGAIVWNLAWDET